MRASGAHAANVTTIVVASKSSAGGSMKGCWLERRERVDAHGIAGSACVEGGYHDCIVGANQLMMLKMHVADKGMAGKIRRALFVSEKCGNWLGIFVRRGSLRHSRSRNNKRNREDKCNEPPAHYTPRKNHPFVSMHSVTGHASVYNNPLIWCKDPSIFRPLPVRTSSAAKLKGRFEVAAKLRQELLQG